MILEGHPEAAREHVDGLGDDADDEHRDQRGADEQHDVEAPDPSLVEPAHALGVDEHRAEAQPGEERRRHARAALVEELDHRGVGADRDDQLRARFVGEQHRDVLARALGDELVVLDAPLEQVLAARRAAVGVHVVHELGAARQAPSRHRVEVADDDVGLEAELEQRVGAAVDADEHRLVLADVRAQRREVVR